MKIGIIGAGNIGSVLALRFSENGHDVRIANSRGPASLADIERQTGATAVEARDAVKGADVVVVTIPQAKVPNLPKDLFAGVPANVVGSTRATIIRSSATGVSRASRRARRRAAGSSSRSAGRS
jgi:predicted dinucleotide-binding enzyme